MLGWWPYYYTMPVGYGYYPYDWYPYGQPQYVVAVPQQTPQEQQPTQCYEPRVDQSGNLIYENGSTVPDLTRPISCFSNQQSQATGPSQQAAPGTTGTKCYGPKVDARGQELVENGNKIPDFTKPIPCP
jgi:hypothetical protein